MPLRPRVLYASYDSVPAPKGASAHILQTVAAIALEADVELLTLPGTLPETPVWPEGVCHSTFVPPGENFLQRALEWGDWVAERILEREYAVVHVRSIWEGTPALLLQPERQYRLVYEANGLPSVELKYHYPGLYQARDLITRFRLQERALLQSAQRVMTQSRTTRRYLAGLGASGDRLRVIPNGVDPERFSTERPARAPGELPEVLYLGTLAPWQGVPFLLHAIRLVADERDVRLRVVGGGRREWRRECERLVRRLGLEEQVELALPVAPEAVPALLAGADVCAAPLTITDRNVLQGCCPIKVLEYMADGRPIAAARMPAVAEILAHEETALLYKPDKPRRLAEALLRLLSDQELAQRLGSRAAEVVRERFTWEAHNQAVAEMYREILAGE